MSWLTQNYPGRVRLSWPKHHVRIRVAWPNELGRIRVAWPNELGRIRVAWPNELGRIRVAWPNELGRIQVTFDRVSFNRVCFGRMNFERPENILAESEWPSALRRIRMGFPWITLAESDWDGRVTWAECIRPSELWPTSRIFRPSPLACCGQEFRLPISFVGRNMVSTPTKIVFQDMEHKGVSSSSIGSRSQQEIKDDQASRGTQMQFQLDWRAHTKTFELLRWS